MRDFLVTIGSIFAVAVGVAFMCLMHNGRPKDWNDK
jgi:hypothetical protein